MVGTSLGRYQILSELGRGGMSVVYRAEDPALGRAVAIKVLHPHLADRPDSRARFSREARAVARLDHHHILDVYDFAPPEAERAYIVAELIEGPTLRAFIEDHPIQRAEAAALIMVPVFEALEHAHRAGVVHRDVKPENVMFRPDGAPVLMDFGIAQIVDMETLTATGTIMGSPAHMAPEIVEGEPVDHRADIFSSGTVLYWLICGALPFSGPNPAALFRRILECRFDPLLQRRPHAGRTLAQLTEQCLAREPDRRPASAQQIADSLRAVLQDGGLDDYRKELAALFQDPEVYQDALVHRLIPPYLQAAERAYNAKLTARALDFLDRILALDEQHPEACDLLARIERGRRSSLVLRSFAAAGIAAALGVIGMKMWESGPEVAELDDSTPTAAVSTPLRPDRIVETRDAEPEEGSATRDADAVASDSIPGIDGETDAAPDARAPDAAPARVAPPTVIRANNRFAGRRPSAIKPLPALNPDAAVKRSPVPQEVHVSALPKRAVMIVDGQEFGEVWSTARTPLKLLPGRHRIEFVHEQCRPAVTFIDVIAGKRPRVSWRCSPKPATLRINSNESAAIWHGTSLLGRTNQDISVEIRGINERFELTLTGPGNTVKPKQVNLVAAKRTTEKVDF